ncbi:MAG: carbohydrate kinase [Haliscomenobacter sp.]|nr:carbohydrate kinase [Haliscomenobacter sp.]MBK8657009.1 carbohydrate kinase [Haliscomenobacter sp.]MBP9077350.1 carbohydrate kinase [Haliscomenobacter sp.]MBP9873044.1 carbohydrate kinase [Haliscomenobacter sp.]
MVDAAALFEQFNQINVLIVGDVMIDRYLTGEVNRVSPEAPVPVVQFQRSEDRLGGAANVALNINALGATPYLCSVIGTDEDSKRFLDLLPPQSLSAKGILQSPERVTTVKTRVMAGNQHLLRIDREVTSDISDREHQQLLETIREILDTKGIRIILFQDYNKGVLTQRLIRDVMMEAIRRDLPTAVDPKYHNFWAYKHVTLFKPNLKEIRAQVPGPVETHLDSLQQASLYIREKLGNAYTMITLSEKGLFLDAQGKTTLLPTQPRSVADVSGAGDTVISIVSIGLALNIDMEQVGILANLAGGQVCEHVGVVPVNKEQLLREYEDFLKKS